MKKASKKLITASEMTAIKKDLATIAKENTGVVITLTPNKDGYAMRHYSGVKRGIYHQMLTALITREIGKMF